MTDRPSPRFHRDNGSDRINALRRDFEHWYVGAAFDYTANPIGSQNCDLQWRAWLAASDAAAPERAQPVAWRSKMPGDTKWVVTEHEPTVPGIIKEPLCTTPPQPQPHDAAQLARRFHDEYERLAPAFGYETRADTRQFDPESPNGRLMIAVCAAIAGNQDEARDREDAERLEYMFRRYGWDRLENPRALIDAARGAGAEGLANG